MTTATQIDAIALRFVIVDFCAHSATKLDEAASCEAAQAAVERRLRERFPGAELDITCSWEGGNCIDVDGHFDDAHESYIIGVIGDIVDDALTRDFVAVAADGDEPKPTTEITIYDGRQHGGGCRWDSRFFLAHGCPEREVGETLSAYGARVIDWAIGHALESGAYDSPEEIEITVRVEDDEDDVTIEVCG